jgi:Putative zinc-finger
MKSLCDWFNRHRDGMLDPEHQRQFESHMAVCEECRARSFLLNNVVSAFRNQDLPDPADRPERVANRAYDQGRSWDVLFLSWLRPAPAFSGLAVLMILLSFLWLAPPALQPISGSEYGALLTGGDQASQGENTLTTLTDVELEAWLEQGGTAK